MKAVALKTFTLQHDYSDCGVACLRSILKYHGSDCSLEQLRKLSGTSNQGTTLLGLLQAAQQLGLDAEGLEAESIENLRELENPAVLHVITGNRLQHYVVFYPWMSDQFLIGDPAEGIMEMNLKELNGIWQEKTLLKLTPTERLVKKEEHYHQKKRWIIGIIKDDFPLLMVSLFLGIAISLLGISTAIFSQKLIDDILPKENTQKLILSLVLVSLLLIARAGLGYVRGLLMVRQGMDFNNRIIKSFYRNLLSLPKSFFDTRKTGEIIARMNDTRRIQSVLSTLSGSILIDFLIVIVSLSLVFAYSPMIGIILLGSLPIYFSILYLFNRPIINTQKEVMGGYALAESNFVDTVQGVADIKLMNKQEFFESVNERVYGVFQQKVANLAKLSIRFGLASEIIGIVLIVSIFGMAALLILSKELKLGGMVALLSIAGNVVPSVTRLVIANVQIQEAMVAFERAFEFTLMQKEAVVDVNPSLTYSHIEIQNLSFRFPGRKEILRSVNLNFNRGEIVALLGESGGGKSTLLQLIQKFYISDTGAILVDQTNIEQVNTALWRKRIGCVTQEVKIFNGTLLFNITLSEDRAEYQRAIIFCKENNFEKYFIEFPQGYLTLIGEEGINISGGQKQLIALVRAMFRNPSVLLLDEATSAMDKNMESFVLEFLKKEKYKMSVLMVTHRMRIADFCDRIYFLENGVVSLRHA